MIGPNALSSKATSREKRLQRWLLALLPALAALVVQWMLWGLIEPYVWFLFYPAVFVSSRIGGLRPGLLATVVSTGIVWWFFVSPRYSMVKDARQLFPASVFLSMGVLFAIFHERLRRANQRAADALATARAANEEISRLYEKTKELDELKTQLFANVSHELRTPLALILGPAQRALDASDTPEPARRDLETIVRNARTLLRHVDDLLDLSKLEAARMEVEYFDTDVTRLARFVASHFEVLAHERRFTYAVDIPEGLHAQIDPIKVQRILLNLLSNAFKFTPGGGRVRLSVRAAGGRLVVEVADSGPGIPPDKREVIFERFRQLEGGATRRHGGTGLGLAIARELVALHAGTVAVGEAPEGGALFRVSLPLTAPAGADVRAMPAGTLGVEGVRQAAEELRGQPGGMAHPARAADGPFVLVVEDNPEMNRFICESLASEYRVATAFDGAEGLRKALEARPDVILIDVMMPEMSGDELVHVLRSHRELDRTPILVLTAKADDELRVRLLRQGAQDYLTKPFLVEELRSRTRNLLAGRRTLEALEYFGRVGEVLASTLDCHEMTRRVAEASVPFLGDVCGVLVTADDQIWLDAFHATPVHVSVAEGLKRYGLEAHSMLRHSTETRQSALVRELSPDSLETSAQTDPHLPRLGALGARSLVVAPLLAHGRCHGAISFVSTGPSRCYGADDLRLVEELGRRFGLALDNAFLYEDLRLQGTITAHLAEGVLLIRAEDERIVYTNPRFDEMFGYASGELIGQRVSVINAPGTLSPQQVADEIHWHLRTTGVWHGEIENIKKDGTHFWCYASVSTFEHPRLGPVWVAVRTDITERKRMEEQRALSLREKEVLLQEIHHRVKNNLQVISSLFYLQSRRTADPQLRQLLDESRSRIQSIALVHDQLYRSKSLAGIDFGEYLRSLVAGIEATYGARGIGVRVDARGVFLDIEQAVPCGLLVSELMSNAFKHAFPNERAGTVSVSVRKEGGRDIVLEVADDGVGIPEGMERRESRTLGLQLVHSLTTQLRGAIELDRSRGTRFTVRFHGPSSPAGVSGQASLGPVNAR